MIKRHKKILELIQLYDIGTQEEIAKHLSQEGYKITQATVSRDIKKLRLIKKIDEDGNSKYVSSDDMSEENNNAFSIFQSSVISMDYTDNLIVIKTHPGMAQAVGAAIDGLNITNVLGCIAGDDTLLVVSRDKKAAEKTIKRFKNLR